MPYFGAVLFRSNNDQTNLDFWDWVHYFYSAFLIFQELRV